MAELRDNRALILEVNEVIRKLESVANEIRDPKKRRRIVSKHANLVVDKAQKIAPKGTRRHFQYATRAVKLNKSKRAAPGEGIKVARYDPGNLRGSIQKLFFKRSPAVFIGPKIARRVKEGSIFGPISGQYNAYYAQMVFGSAKAFRDRVMVPALVSVSSQLVKEIGASALRIIKREAKKQGLAA